MTVAKSLPADLIDSQLSGYKKPEDLIGEHGLLKQLTKALVERALAAEMAAYLGHARHEAVTNPAGNVRNGKSSPESAYRPLSRRQARMRVYLPAYGLLALM